ncbi:MAG: molybdopterin-dependent oxidoreductase [Oscillospiraceae bacterium]|nr:molybdopterin-dependent oxidoreductase [Oscillospiraceae bacterium]
MGVFKTACRGCHGGCVFDMTVENGRVVAATPAKDGPLNQGRGCMKGRSIIEQMYHPDRLLYPMKRTGERGEGKWTRISWDDAYDTIAEKMNGLIKEYGPQCISSLTGTGRHHLPYLSRLANAIGTPNASTAGGLICLGPRRTAAAMTSGLFCGVDYYGPTRPGGILVWGANPAISGADGELQWLIRDAVQEGIPMVVVDPKPTELARKAKIWLKIRPGTDGALALGILNILISEDLYDHDFVENYTVGFAELKERCKEYTLEKVSGITWIPESQILEAAHWIAHTKPLGLEQGCAFEQSVNAMDTCRAIIMIPAITGNYDVPGGFVESMEIAPAGLPLSNEIPEEMKAVGITGGYPFTEHDVMSHPYLMLEAIRTGKPYPIRGMFIHANNTLLSMADAKHTRECLMKLDFLVYMDIFMNPTAELADIVLPAALWPEVDCVFAMPEFGDQVLLSQQKLVQVGECKMDEEFFIELCQRAGWNYGYTSHRQMMEEQIREMVRRRPEYADFTLDHLREKGYLAPERTYYNYKRQGFDTPTKKYEFKSTMMEMQGYDPIPSWHEPPETPVSRPDLTKEYPLILTTGGRQQPYFISNNRQIRSLRRAEPFPRVRMSPKTAAVYGLAEGDWAFIETPRGKITQKVKLEEGWDDRVINCDFAWWYPEAGAPGYGWDESNVNVLTWGDAPYDKYLGSYQFRGLLCRISKNESCSIEQRYYNSKYYLEPETNTSDSLVVNSELCVLCGECVRTCERVHGIGALKLATVEGITRVIPAVENSMRASGCVGCGQCQTACPMGAIEIVLTESDQEESL